MSDDDTKPPQIGEMRHDAGGPWICVDVCEGMATWQMVTRGAAPNVLLLDVPAAPRSHACACGETLDERDIWKGDPGVCKCWKCGAVNATGWGE